MCFVFVLSPLIFKVMIAGPSNEAAVLVEKNNSVRCSEIPPRTHMRRSPLLRDKTDKGVARNPDRQQREPPRRGQQGNIVKQLCPYIPKQRSPHYPPRPPNHKKQHHTA